MSESFVLTFSGHDRPGIVNAISEQIAAAGGSWLESRLARLAQEFAGIVLISAPSRNAETLMAGLRRLENSGLRLTVARSEPPAESRSRIVDLSLVGHDRPGIVRDVTQALSQLGANIEEFGSGIESAPFTGETMFRATARLRLPSGVTRETVRASLERLADEIMVDLIESET
jgi:glycine cleavage system regulatory protein